MEVDSNEEKIIKKRDENEKSLENKNQKENCENEELTINPYAFQLNLKVDLSDLLCYRNSDYGCFKTMHILSNNKYGIVIGQCLIIISDISFKIIKVIKPNYQEFRSVRDNIYNDKIDDFIELNNSDIVIWSPNVILIYDK